MRWRRCSIGVNMRARLGRGRGGAGSWCRLLGDGVNQVAAAWCSPVRGDERAVTGATSWRRVGTEEFARQAWAVPAMVGVEGTAGGVEPVGLDVDAGEPAARMRLSRSRSHEHPSKVQAHGRRSARCSGAGEGAGRRGDVLDEAVGAAGR